jgi:hypothetical protein
MSKDKPKNDSITIPVFVPVFKQIPWLNTEQEDYKLLKNKPTSLWDRYFAMDIWSSSGSAWDWMFRDVNLIGTNWDREITYSQEIIVGRWSTTAKITRSENITPISNAFTLKPWQIFSITSYFNSSTQTVRISRTGSSVRYLRAWATPLDITSANPELIFINSGTTDSSIKLTFGTTASDRPIFGFLINITW